jgi:hypothetical protein
MKYPVLHDVSGLLESGRGVEVSVPLVDVKREFIKLAELTIDD